MEKEKAQSESGEDLALHGWSMADLEAALLESWSPPKAPDMNPISVRSHVGTTSDKENKSANSTRTTSCPPPSYIISKPMISCPPPSIDETLPNGWKLFPHQKDAIIEALQLQRVILAYDMGLGKTCISLVWAREMSKRIGNCLTVVVCPCTLAETWRREACSLGFHEESRGTSCIRICSWAKVPTTQDLLHNHTQFLLLCDESHAMQTLKSQRTKAVLQLSLHWYHIQRKP
jgi:hypothetical protein